MGATVALAHAGAYHPAGGRAAAPPHTPTGALDSCEPALSAAEGQERRTRPPPRTPSPAAATFTVIAAKAAIHPPGCGPRADSRSGADSQIPSPVRGGRLGWGPCSPPLTLSQSKGQSQIPSPVRGGRSGWGPYRPAHPEPVEGPIPNPFPRPRGKVRMGAPIGPLTRAQSRPPSAPSPAAPPPTDHAPSATAAARPAPTATESTHYPARPPSTQPPAGTAESPHRPP